MVLHLQLVHLGRSTHQSVAGTAPERTLAPTTMALVALALLLLAFTVSLFYLLRKPTPPRSVSDGTRRRLPPSPRGLPLLGHLHLLGSLPHRALRSLAVAHGPVLLLQLGRVPAVLVSSAAAAEEVMRTRDLAFASRPPSAMAERLLYGRDVAFAPYGEYWRQARRVCVVHLLSPVRILSFRRVREEEAAALVESVRAAGAGGAVVDLCEPLIAYANTVVSRAAFGDESARGLYDDGDKGRVLRKVFTDFEELLGTAPLGGLLPWLGWVDAVKGTEGKIRRTFEALDGVLEKVIDDHRRRRHAGRQTGEDSDDHRDFVDVLLEVNETDKETGIQLDTIEIKAIILDMFAAGTDTTSTAMEWAIAELIAHPHSMRKLQDELRAVVGDADQHVVTEDHLDKLRYLKAVVKETLRLHPPIPLLVPREPPNDAEILGYHIPARTRVVINAWAIGRDSASWDRAEEFMPERFLESAVDYRGQDFELIPFGAGRRGCPGVGFAVPTVEMALASLLYNFDLAPAAGTSLDMREVNGLAVHLKSGLPLVAKPRFS
ncbi:cytochrome P450 71A1-like [Lolium rigidum]|uniref:cytochrome P450 71A1-like n=1 Tax=Lolium rigidum TaxID=89674 RepID=UPI001F5C3A1E|nr:cytochrome P450 71A1-like [Lolium rigidum]